jgi:uncharacterized protein YjiS (DUF1127 family)
MRRRAASLLSDVLTAWRARRRRETPLFRLSDHLLRDVGLARDQIERER